MRAAIGSAHAEIALRCRALGYEFVIRCAHPELMAHLGHVFGSLEDPAADAHVYEVQDFAGWAQITLDGAVAVDNVRLPDVVEFIQTHVNLAAVVAPPPRLFLHAGGVSSGLDAVVLPAASGSGKTSLTVALVGAGLGYLSDEALAVDPDDLSITPFPKSFTIKASGQHLFPRLGPAPGTLAERFTAPYAWHVPVAEVRRDCVGTAGCRARLIISPRYVAGSPTEVRPLSHGEAMLVLGQNSSSLRALGDRVLETLERVARSAPAYALTFSDLGAARAEVLRLFEEVR
ncbi:MAG TPA: hypothetical protein VNB94_02160 [Mycobacteriales bacterium]|nr:hypothetical protein [Mycobacteriales bacterium]